MRVLPSIRDGVTARPPVSAPRPARFTQLRWKRFRGRLFGKYVALVVSVAFFLPSSLLVIPTQVGSQEFEA